MKLQELQKLAERVQLKIKPEEADYLLDSLSKLEKLLVEFRKINLKGKRSGQSRAKITLKNLHQLAKKFTSHSSEQETVFHNAKTSAENFLVIRKR
jgi:hypothetical protein